MFPLVDAPAHLPLIEADQFDAMHRIDYAAHPAYAELVRGSSRVVRFAALRRFLPSLLLIKIKRLIRYEMIPLHVRRGAGLAGRLRLLMAALANVFTGSQRPEPGAQQSPLEVRLRRQGVVVVQISSQDLDTLKQLSKEWFDRLHAHRTAAANGPRSFEASRSYVRWDEDGALYEGIETLLERSGVLPAARAYLGPHARLVDVNPQINDPSDDFWKRIFPDRDETLPRSAYLHRDASGGDLKAIIYLTEVGSEQGPFGYVLGSHRLSLSRAEDHVCEANDSNGLAGTEPGTRQLFAGLPPSLRLKGAFGNDLQDNDPASQSLLRSLWSITAPAASIVLFDTKGVHRGGMVANGERRVITCVLG
jgi:hypothetical protein